MKKKPSNYFKSLTDLEALTENCTYLSLLTADVAITEKGNLFVYFKKSEFEIDSDIKCIVEYLIREGFNIKVKCSVFLY